MGADPFVVHVARLRRTPQRRLHEVRRGEVALAGPLEEAVDPGRSVVPAGAEAEVDVTLIPFEGGIEVDGTVSAPWTGICRRCAEPVSGELRIHVHERFAEADALGPIGRGDLPDHRRRHRLGAHGAGRRRARAAHGTAVPGRLCGPVPPLRGEPQRGRLWLRCPTRSPVG